MLSQRFLSALLLPLSGKLQLIICLKKDELIGEKREMFLIILPIFSLMLLFGNE